MSRGQIRLLIAFCLGFALVWLSPKASRSETQAPFPVFAFKIDEPDWSRKSCGPVCTVTFNPGGRIYHYIEQAHQIKKDNILLKIDGPCYSACTVAADKARPNVCITQRAVMQFHNGIALVPDAQYPDTVFRKIRMDISTAYSQDILEWVRGNGGFPGMTAEKSELEKYLPMYYDQARRFFSVCK